MGPFKRASKNIQLATETMQMWQGHTEALQAMQDDHERTVRERTGPDFEPVAGVDVQSYGEILRDIEATPGGADRMDEIAQRHGAAPGAWDQVWREWNARTLRNSAVGEAINRAYRGV